MKEILIPKSITDKILMVGNYYEGNAVGGMASVVRVYKDYYETFRYISSWRDISKLGKLSYAVWAYLRALFELAFNNNIKILHVHVASSSSFYRKAKFIKLAKFFGKKVIFHMHSAVFKEYFVESNDKEYILGIIRCADKFIALSQSWKDWYVGIGIDADKIVVINNPVCAPKCMSFTENASVRMLFLGDLRERKGIWDVLKAINDNKREFEGKLKFCICGNKRENDVKSFIRNNNIDNIVLFEGWVSGDKKWQLLNWANIVILPSFNEGLPITLLEAMAYNCALISTPVGGIPEILHDKDNGLMVTPGNSEEIADAIRFYINNPDAIYKAGKQSYKYVVPFLPTTVFDQLNKLYKELL